MQLTPKALFPFYGLTLIPVLLPLVSVAILWWSVNGFSWQWRQAIRAPTWSLLCEFLVCVLYRLSARVFVSGASFLTGWTFVLCEVGIKFNICVILAHNDEFWLYFSIYQIINILGYAFCNCRSWVWYIWTSNLSWSAGTHLIWIFVLKVYYY